MRICGDHEALRRKSDGGREERARFLYSLKWQMLGPPRNSCNIHRMGQPKPFDFAVIGEPLNKLLIATGNKLSREWPAKYQNVTGARELFVIHLRTAHMTYLSALYLGRDKLPSDGARPVEICVSLPVLNRAVLDSLSRFFSLCKMYRAVALGSANRTGRSLAWNWKGIPPNTGTYRSGSVTLRTCLGHVIWDLLSPIYHSLKRRIRRLFAHGLIQEPW